MSSSSAIAQIDVGDAVYSSDGNNLGTVAAVYPGYIAIEKGFFFPTDYYIPRDAVTSTSGSDVFLAVTKEAALNQGWDTEPTDLGSATIATMTDNEDLATLATARRTEVTAAAGEDLRIPVVEEEWTATVRPVEAGAVRIEKDVVTEDRVLEVPVTEERLRIERRIVDRAATDADAALFEETLLDVPLQTETVDVQKEARVKEEIVISKEAVQRTERVAGTVRREEVRIDETGADASLIDDREPGSGSRP